MIDKNLSLKTILVDLWCAQVSNKIIAVSFLFSYLLFLIDGQSHNVHIWTTHIIRCLIYAFYADIC